MKTTAACVLALFCLSACLATSAGADEVRLEVSFAAPQVVQSPLGDVLSVAGAELAAPAGHPWLPRRTYNLVVPYGHRVESLRLEAVEVEPLSGRFDIAPAQRPVPLSALYSPAPTERDPAVYLRDGTHPASWAVLGAIQTKRGVAIAPVTVFPLSYRPASGQVERLVSARLVLTTKPAGFESRLLRGSTSDVAQVARWADSSKALVSYPKHPSRAPTRLDPGAYDYLIVAPEAFVDLGGEYSLEALMTLRQGLGMAAHLVTVEWILANYPGDRPDGGQDDATRIREFLADAYLEWGVTYVLLVGDADAEATGGESGPVLLPVRKLYVDVRHPDAAADVLPADMYYGNLDGDFDSDGDGLYGEPTDGPAGAEVDLLAELYVGRVPADRATEVRNFVAKTLAYEAGAGAWLKNVLMVGELLWNDPTNVWGGDAMDELIDGSNAGGFTTLGFSSLPFFEPSTLYDRDRVAAWAVSDLVPLLNEGPHVVNHLGHSDVTYNMRMGTGHADGLINSHPFLHYSQGCYNGSFDNRSAPEAGGFVYGTDCFAEHLVTAPHGAFAAVANSRYGWGSFMTDGPSQRFHRQFWDAFFADGVATIGEAQARSKEDNAGGFVDPYIRWVGYESNLIGDPAVALKKSLNTDQPLLGLYPPALQFIGRVGDPAPEPQVMRVRNDGLDSLSFSLQADQAWVSVTPTSGDAPADLEVQVNPDGLSPGLNTAVLTMESPEAANSPLTALVEYLLVEPPHLQVPHLGLAPSLDGSIGPDEYDGALAVPIDGAEAGEVVMHLAVTGTTLHLAIEDHLDGSDSDFDRVILFFDRDLDGQWPAASGDEGMYMLMSRNGGAVMFMPIFNPGDGEQFDYYGHERDPAGFVGVLGMQADHRVYEVALDLETSRIDVGPVGSFGVFVSVSDGDNMGSGVETGWWPSILPTLADQTYFGRLDMLPGEPWLGTVPGALAFEVVHNRAESVSMSASVVELLGGSVDFTAMPQQDWISVEPAGGRTPSELLVTVDPSGFDVGMHSGQLTLEAGGVGNSPHQVPVTLEVLPEPALLQVSPDRLDVSVMEGEAEPVIEVTVTNAGEEEMGVVIGVTGSWLGTSPAFLTVPGGTEQVVEVFVSLDGLELGSYAGQIDFVAAGAEGSPVNLPVELEYLRFNTPPPVPELLTPDDGARVKWPFELIVATVEDPEGDPVSYTFEVLDGAGEIADAGQGSAGDGTATRMTADLPKGEYTWRVEAFDNRNASSGPSQERSLVVGGKGSGGCGCAHSDRPLAWPLLLVLMGLGCLLRRR